MQFYKLNNCCPCIGCFRNALPYIDCRVCRLLNVPLHENKKPIEWRARWLYEPRQPVLFFKILRPISSLRLNANLRQFREYYNLGRFTATTIDKIWLAAKTMNMQHWDNEKYCQQFSWPKIQFVWSEHSYSDTCYSNEFPCAKPATSFKLMPEPPNCLYSLSTTSCATNCWAFVEKRAWPTNLCLRSARSAQIIYLYLHIFW